MSLLNKFGTLALMATVALTPLAYAQSAEKTADKALTRADVEAIVQDYIANNGDKLMQSVQDYQTRKMKAAVAGIVRPFNPTKGPATAPVTIVEFVDFECPFCARVHPTTEALDKKYGSKLRWVAKNAPLPFHPKAPGAAYAAQAAYNQGKYWQFQQKLWEHQDALGDELYTQTAKELKLDLKKFDKDRASPEVKATVDVDKQDGQAVGAQGTPFFLINGTPVSGAQPLENFTAVIDALLAGKTPPAPGQ